MKKVYLVTSESPRDLRQRANGKGEITLTDRQAEYELLRGTVTAREVVDKAKPPAPARANGRS